MRGYFLFLALLTTLHVGRTARAFEGALSLTPPDESVGFTLDEDWREWWRRVLDRGGRYDPTGSIQQRFPIEQYQEHEADKVTANFPLNRERSWAESDIGMRWWVQSYNATELGNKVQLKLTQEIGDHVQVSTRLDRFYDRATASNFVQTDFTWTSEGDVAPYYQISVTPRLEKQDSDIGFTIGLKARHHGDLRLRLWGIDAFANGSYWLARQRKPPTPLLLRQTALPIGAALELATLRVGGLRAELYLGGVASQSRELYLDGVLSAIQTESGVLFGGLLEWKAPQTPLWLGATAMLVSTQWSSNDLIDPALSRRIREHTRQARLYGIFIPDHHLVLESELKLTARPESEVGPSVLRQRKDNEHFFITRAQWLVSNRVGLELLYFNNNRDVEGGPNVAIEGGGNRIGTRLLLRYQHFLATFGAAWDPDPRRSIYAGAGGTMIVEFD